MKDKLDREEQQILRLFKQGKLQHVGLSSKELKKYQDAAKAKLLKNVRINLRISADTLYALQKKAQEEGIPYQTFIGSILHKFANGRLADKS